MRSREIVVYTHETFIAPSASNRHGHATVYSHNYRENANILVTPLLRCITATFVHLKVPSSEAAYHGSIPLVYVDAISSVTKRIYYMFAKCDVPIRSYPILTGLQ